MGKQVDIDAVIAEIESAIAENEVEANANGWIAKAKSLATAEFDRRGAVPYLWQRSHCEDDSDRSTRKGGAPI